MGRTIVAALALVAVVMFVVGCAEKPAPAPTPGANSSNAKPVVTPEKAKEVSKPAESVTKTTPTTTTTATPAPASTTTTAPTAPTAPVAPKTPAFDPNSEPR